MTLVRRTPLKRKTPLKRTGGIRRVSRKRARQYREYMLRRALFLVAHPYCQVWLTENSFTEAQAIEGKGIVIRETMRGVAVMRAHLAVPASEEIHHRCKRRGMTLLDESTWMAVSHDNHMHIENNKSWARERGYLAHF